MRCAEAVWTLLFPGHRCDPGHAVTYTRLTTLGRILMSHPEIHAVHERLWHTVVHKRLKSGGARSPIKKAWPVTGPLSLLAKEVHDLGWQWPTFWAWELSDGTFLPVVEGPTGWWEHVVRDQLRRRKAGIAVGRREDMLGLLTADREAVLQVLKTPKAKEK